MPIEGYRLATVSQFVGRELGVSPWMDVTQQRVDQFAECTGDRQWIHIDVERAKRESPFGGTIAHGYLLLSLLGPSLLDLGIIPPDVPQAVVYGLDKVRFMSPVRAGARVRGRVSLVSAEDKGKGRMLLTSQCSLEIEGEEKPALMAQVLVMLLAGG